METHIPVPRFKCRFVISMPAYVNLPWLDVSPRDFLQAAESGGRLGQEASQFAKQNALREAQLRAQFLAAGGGGGGGGGTPRTYRAAVSVPRGESGQDAYYRALANLANQEASPFEMAGTTLSMKPTPEEQAQTASATAKTNPLVYEGIGQGGKPGVLNRETGIFTPLPESAQSATTRSIDVPLTVSPATPDRAAVIVKVPSSELGKRFTSLPADVQALPENQAIYKMFQQAPGTTPATNTVQKPVLPYAPPVENPYNLYGNMIGGGPASTPESAGFTAFGSNIVPGPNADTGQPGSAANPNGTNKEASSQPGPNDVIRITNSGRRAVFNAQTKEFVRYAD